MNDPDARLAGSDTREAFASPTVRAASLATALITGPGWLAVFAAPGVWRRFVALPAALEPWVVLGLAAAGVAAAVLAWRTAPDPAAGQVVPPGTQRSLPAGLGSSATVGFGALIVATTRDAGIAAIFLPMAALLCGWAVGVGARLAAAACVPQIRAAAGGVVTTGALAGLVFAAHLGLVARGSGLGRAGAWTVAYALLACANFVRASLFLGGDRRRIAARVRFEEERAARPLSLSGGALALESVSVRFGAATVLRDTNLEVLRGELLALVGGNGAGKSTLLRTAAGFITPEAGRVHVGGEDVTTLLPEQRVTAGLVFVSGARPVFPDLTVLENLRVAAFQTHATARAFAAATDSVLELVPALAARRRAKAGVLSGGEQRLLAVAQTLYRKPLVLLADELSLGLDLQARLAVLDLLRLLADQGVAVVCVDHDLPTLLSRADRAALLSAGEVTIHAEPIGLLERRSDLLPATFLAGAAR